MRGRTMMILAAGGLLVAAPLVAQDPPQRPRMQMHGVMGMQEMMGMHASPQMILRMREPLGLTEQQVQRLEAIQREMQQAHQPHMHAAMQSMQEAHRLLEGDQPDWGGYEAQLREAANHHVQAHLAMTRAMVEARNVLSAEQRARLEMGTRLMREMMMQEGMPGMGPGMHPGPMPRNPPRPEHQHRPR